jgi:hypothetical protein
VLDKDKKEVYSNIMSETVEEIELLDWIQVGVDKGWVSPAFCNTHDGDAYMTEDEEKEWEDGGDPCMPVLKLLNQF